MLVSPKRRTAQERPSIDAYRAQFEAPGSTLLAKDIADATGVKLPTVFLYIRRHQWRRNADAARGSGIELGPWPAPKYTSDALIVVVNRIRRAFGDEVPSEAEVAASICRPITMVRAALSLMKEQK